MRGMNVLVTGGSRGIGRAVAIAVAERGAARVTIGFHEDDSSARDVAAEVASRGAVGVAVRADVADAEQAAGLVTAAAPEGRLDALVCAAGVSLEELLVTTSDDQLARTFAVNTLGAIHCLRAATPLLLRRRAGSVVLVSSVAAQHPGRGQAAYAASKGALESLARAAAAELGGKGIRVNAVAPGVVETTMTEELRASAGALLVERIALRRYARPEEIARVVAFLLSEEASYVTGAVIPVDGGWR